MNLNLSSQIVLNKVSEQFYAPKTAVERSEITQREKITTDIFPAIDKATNFIVDKLQTEIEKQMSFDNEELQGIFRDVINSFYFEKDHIIH